MENFAKLGINFPVIIGPMVGISHIAFRKLIKMYTPPNIVPIIFSEMLSTRRIPSENFHTSEVMRFAPNESGLVIQLLGNEEEYIKKSIARLQPYGPFGFDINMGCPARNVLKHNHGVNLMEDPSLAAEIVRVTKRCSEGPISVKIRGVDAIPSEIDALLNFSKVLQSAGADWLTVHARPKVQKHKGEANWELGKILASNLDIPVVLNGGIQTSQDAINIIKNYEVAGVMLARAAVARPWILWQIAEDLNISTTNFFPGLSVAPRTAQEEGDEFINAVIALLKFLCEDFNNEKFICERVAFYCAIASPWLEFGHSLWKITTKAKNVKELEEYLFRFKEQSKTKMVEKIVFWN